MVRRPSVPLCSLVFVVEVESRCFSTSCIINRVTPSQWGRCQHLIDLYLDNLHIWSNIFFLHNLFSYLLSLSARNCTKFKSKLIKISLLLNHDLASVHDVETLCRLSYTLASEVVNLRTVNCQLSTVN